MQSKIQTIISAVVVLAIAFSLLMIYQTIKPSNASAQTGCSNIDSSLGTASGSITAAVDGQYTAWSRLKGPSGSNPKIIFSHKDNCSELVTGTRSNNTWEWVKHSTLLNLAANESYDVKVAGSTAGTGFDCMIFVLDDRFVPDNSASECSSVDFEIPDVTGPDPGTDPSTDPGTDPSTDSGTDPDPGNEVPVDEGPDDNEISIPQPANGDTIIINAAGVMGDELMELHIYGTKLRTWTVATGARAGLMKQYTYTHTDSFDVGDVEIRFTNDRHKPKEGITRDIRIDNVQVGNVIYETEDASTQSKGTWDGSSCGVGNKQSEWLHCNGYMRFSNDNQLKTIIDAPVAATVTVVAAGNEGDEKIELRIKDVVVRTWTLNEGYKDRNFETFTYSHDTLVSADDVKVAFINDKFDKVNRIFRDVKVDYITVGGIIYESEHSATFSTGTYTSSGCDDDFKQSEILNCNGYFAYGRTGGTFPDEAAPITGDSGGGALPVPDDDNTSVPIEPTTPADDPIPFDIAKESSGVAVAGADGVVDIWDVSYVVDNWKSRTNEVADVNEDGRVNWRDLQIITAAMSSTE